MEQHLHLLIEYKDGKPLREPVHVESLGDGRFKILYTPGFVEGIAAGDEIKLTGEDGAFEIIRRGGNIAVKLFARESVMPFRNELHESAVQLGGSLDGAIERGMSFTFPLSTGFATIEKFFNTWVETHEGWTWYYGNIYDLKDGHTPLGWWNAAEPKSGFAGLWARITGKHSK